MTYQPGQHVFSTEQEAVLMARIKAGDAAACGEVAVAFMPLINRLARKAAGRLAGEAEDLQQSIICKILQPELYQNHVPDAGHSLEQLITGVARFSVIDEIRLRGRWSGILVSGDTALGDEDGAQTHFDLIASTAAGPEQINESRQISLRVAAAFARLSAQDQTLIERVAEGDKPGDVAADMGLSPEVVRQRLSRARKSMQQAYAG